MDNNNYKRARILLLIPIIVLVLKIVCLGALTISYLSTGNDATAVALIFAGSMSALFTTVPCLVMAVLGTVFAQRAKMEGIIQAGKFHVLGVIECVVYGIGLTGTVIAAAITVLAITG